MTTAQPRATLVPVRTEIDRLELFDRVTGDTEATLVDAVVQGLDLRDRVERLADVPVQGAVFLGCRLDATSTVGLIERGAVVYPELAGLPFRAYRNRLYSPAELYEGYRRGDPSSVEDTLDSRIHRWNADGGGLVDAMAKRSHDASIDDALAELLATDAGAGVVAVMGGHGLRRDEAGFAAVARLGRALARAGFLVASGGGPGAMEATNLGAWLAPAADAALDGAVDMLAAAPTYRPVARWLATAWDVVDEFGAEPGPSLGIPTWHYGHEPPNVFATAVAKYFDNSIREDGLLAIAGAGVIFTPGSAGTIQEVFQDAAQNHYETFGGPSPMVFFGVDHWTRRQPVYPLLVELARGRPYADLLAVVDDVDAVVDHLATS